jgi:hypothetical protein
MRNNDMTIDAARDLHRDQRGAIMLMGLCMSCFLIGGLWFLIGIGDTIVFRDTMQEAADHAAFTSAVLHAKGMNFISACNLILLALIAIHIIMGLIHDVLLAICIVGAFFSAGTACIPWTRWRPIYTGYGRAFKQVANVIHYLEQGAAVGYPFIGTAKAFTLGRDYGQFGPKKRDLNVIALSTSLIPGNAMSGVVNRIFRQRPADTLPPGVEGPTRPASAGYSAGTKSFLPVEAKHFDSVCERISNVIMSSLAELTGWGSWVDNDVFKGLISAGIKLRYCNDLGSGAANSAAGAFGGKVDKGNEKIEEDNKYNQDKKLGEGETRQTDINKVKTDGIGGAIDPGFDSWWGKDGPFVPWGGTSNGSPWQQIWALNVLPDFTDAQQHRVHVAANNKHVESDSKAWAYLSQAEFFFDCTKKWSEGECNGDDNAAYSIKWRARLRRLQLPQVGSLLSSFGGEFLKNMTAYTDLKNKLGGLAESFGKAIGVSSITGAVDGLVKMAEDAVGGKIGDAGSAVDGAINGATGNFGAYH